MKIKNNSRVYHIDQKVTYGFPSLRIAWIAELFITQLKRKAIQFDIKILNYCIMSTHYHLEVVVPNAHALRNFLPFLIRDFTRGIRKAIRGGKKEKNLELFLTTKIFEKRPFCRPIYSLYDLWTVFRYITLNPFRGDNKCNAPITYYNTGAHDIYEHNQGVIDFPFLRFLLGEKDLLKCVQICELDQPQFDSFMKSKFKNWSENDDQKLLQFSSSLPWPPETDKNLLLQSSNPIYQDMRDSSPLSRI